MVHHARNRRTPATLPHQRRDLGERKRNAIIVLPFLSGATTVKIRFLFITLLAAFGLAGCFTSDKPLFTDDQAAAPYAKITFAEEGSPEDKTTMTREGKAYVADLDDGTMTLRFMPLGDNLYLTESTGEEDGKLLRLYAVVQLDPAQNVAMAHKVMAADSDIGQGLPNCHRQDMDMVCIENVDAYVALAKATIAAGTKPDTTYNVTLE
jgi:hypothetical protein